MTDRGDFGAFVVARQAQLHALAYALTGDWQLAEDAVQTAFEKLYVAWPRVKRDGREDAYARTVVRHAVIDASRRPWRRERPTARPVEVERATANAAEPHDPQVTKALLALPIMQRQVVVLRHLMDLSVAQVARELQISEGSVKSHTSRALSRLTQLLGDQNKQEEHYGH